MICIAMWACSHSEKSITDQNTVIMLSDSTRLAISEMRNKDIHWDGTDVGLIPTIQNAQVFALIHEMVNIDSLLISCIHDPERFAVAHVILSQRHPSAFESAGNEWNHLHISLEANGEVKYSPESDIPNLLNLWDGKR
jgi:hypothetical protein